jgi:hypothetical protein
VLYLRLIIFSVGGDVSIDSETLLMTDFVNLKIKSAQSFEYTHIDKVCMCVYRDECSYVYTYLYLYYYVSKKSFYATNLNYI